MEMSVVQSSKMTLVSSKTTGALMEGACSVESKTVDIFVMVHAEKQHAVLLKAKLGVCNVRDRELVRPSASGYLYVGPSKHARECHTHGAGRA